MNVRIKSTSENTPFLMSDLRPDHMAVITEAPTGCASREYLVVIAMGNGTFYLPNTGVVLNRQTAAGYFVRLLPPGAIVELSN